MKKNFVSKNRRWVLLNPGPVNVTERVRRALLGPDLCHREDEFAGLLASVREKLLRIFGISKTHQAVFFTGSGTSALEAMLAAAGDKNKKTLVLSNGVYGERIQAILKIHALAFETLSANLGEFPALARVEERLRRDPGIGGVALVHHETSTGMLNPLSEVAALAKKYRKTLVVDAVSSLGAETIDFKKNRVGFLAGTAGKCLHGFPGVSFVIVSNEEALKLKDKKPLSLALDLAGALRHQTNNDVPFTPAVQLFYAFEEALKELEQEGLAARIRNYAGKNRQLEKGFEELDLRFFVPKPRRSHVLTALWMPSFISYEKLHDALKKAGFVIYAGQSNLKGRIFRVSNLGDVRDGDIRRFLAELKKILGRSK